MRKSVLSILLVLVVLSTAEGSVLFLESGHHTWTDANDYYDEVWLENDGSLDFVGGSVGKLETWDYSATNVYGGQMDWLFSDDSTTINIHGGTLDWLGAFGDSEVYLYAYDVEYHLAGGLENRPWAEGTFVSDHTPFSFTLYDEYSYSHVQVVPEPGSLALLALGSLLLRRRR